MSRDADQPAERPAAEESFLQRWARRKHAAKLDPAAARAAAPQAPAVERPSPAPERSPACVQPPAPAPAPAQAGPISANDVAPAQPTAELPPVESLTFDSDFSAFLAPHVPEELKRQALKKLLHDPRFNVMDGLDVYIEDYSTPSPLAPELVRGLAHARYVFEPPPTRVNAEGQVEDVPAEERARLAASSPSDALPDAAEPNTQAAPDAANSPDESAAHEADRIGGHAPLPSTPVPMPPHAASDTDRGDGEATDPAQDASS